MPYVVYNPNGRSREPFAMFTMSTKNNSTMRYLKQINYLDLENFGF